MHMRACRISIQSPGSIFDDAARLNEYQELGVQRMLDLKRVFAPVIADLTTD